LTELVESVYSDQGLQAPTPIQAMVIPELLQEPPQHVAFLAATGSGKTLAYALPLLQLCKSRELFSSTDVQRKPKRPKVLILAPTRELATQITSVVKQLCHFVKLSSQSIIGSQDYGQQRKSLNRPIDVVIATPGRLLKHWNDGNIFLGDVQHVVLDEMDTMLEQGFQQELLQLLHPLLYKTVSPDSELTLVERAPRIVLTSATMTQAVAKLIGAQKDDSIKAKRHYVKLDPQGPPPAETKKASIIMPEMKIIKAPGLHKSVPRLKQVFVDVGNVDKLTLLVDVVHGGAGKELQDRPHQPLTLVFCNTVASCRAAQHALAEAGLESLGYHGELNSLARAENLQLFRNGDASILVCTDLASRGLDVPQVQHVVMFDFPLNSLDYLHRSGRTARGVDGQGRVTALVAKRDKVLASAIEKAVLIGEPLDGLSSRRTDYLPVRTGPSSGTKQAVGRARRAAGGVGASRLSGKQAKSARSQGRTKWMKKSK
jgi:superfamily II DNA/RNA helicase